MTVWNPNFLCLGAFLALSACAQLTDALQPRAPAGIVDVLRPDPDTLRPQPRPASAATQAVGVAGRSPDALDQTSPDERAAALAPSTERTEALGDTLAALGGVSEPGLWLRTGLVTQVRQGRIELPDGSRSLRVELRPSGAPAGAGSQLSLAAFRSLDLPLTQLVSLRVFAQ